MRQHMTVQYLDAVSRYRSSWPARFAGRLLAALWIAIMLVTPCLVLAVAAPNPQESDDERATSEYTKGVFLLEGDSPQDAVPHPVQFLFPLAAQ